MQIFLVEGSKIKFGYLLSGDSSFVIHVHILYCVNL
jgi:hypothetical protein